MCSFAVFFFNLQIDSCHLCPQRLDCLSLSMIKQSVVVCNSAAFHKTKSIFCIYLSFVCYFFTLTSSSCVGLRIELSIHPFNRSRISKLLNQVVRVVCSSLPKEVVLCCCCCSILLVFFVDHFYYFWCRLSSVRFDFIYVCFRVLFLYSFHMLLWSVCLSDSIAADIHTF